MNDQIEQLIDLYRIKDEQQFQEYKNKAILTIIGGKRPSKDKNTLSIVGGQSGAGKSNLIALLKRNQTDSVVVDFDELRSFHPSYEEVNRTYPEISHRILHPDTERLKNEVLDYLITNGYNTIYEGALRNTQGFVDFAKNFKENGYSVQMNILAVPKLESYGSTLLRYAYAFMTNNYPRWVEKAFHDASYEGVTKTAEAFISEGIADEFNVYIRGEGGEEPIKIFPSITRYFKDPIQAINYGREQGRRKAIQDYPTKRSVVEQILQAKEPETLGRLGEWEKLYKDEKERVESLVAPRYTD